MTAGPVEASVGGTTTTASARSSVLGTRRILREGNEVEDELIADEVEEEMLGTGNGWRGPSDITDETDGDGGGGDALSSKKLYMLSQVDMGDWDRGSIERWEGRDGGTKVMD